MEHEGFNCPIIMADGSLTNNLEKIIQDIIPLTKLNLQYIKCPQDLTYLDYYKKISWVLEKVKTPYVVLLDNDDFPDKSTFNKSVQFLISNPDYIACGGLIDGIIILPDQASSVYGKKSMILPLKCTNSKSLESDLISQRYSSHFNNYTPTFYDIHRIDILKKLFLVLATNNMHNIFLAELFLSFGSLKHGKIKRLQIVYLTRQLNPPSSSAKNENEKSSNVERLLAESWSIDFSIFSKYLTETDEESISTETITKEYARYLHFQIVGSTKERLIRLIKEILIFKVIKNIPHGEKILFLYQFAHNNIKSYIYKLKIRSPHRRKGHLVKFVQTEDHKLNRFKL